MDKPNYYAIIPADVRYDENLKPNEKLLYGEITSLANKSGVCFASNNYFSKLYQVDERTIRRWLNNLENKGYISRVTQHDDNQKIKGRLILINGTILTKKFNTFTPSRYRKVSNPEWLGKEFDEVTATEEEIEEFNKLMSME